MLSQVCFPACYLRDPPDIEIGKTSSIYIHRIEDIYAFGLVEVKVTKEDKVYTIFLDDVKVDKFSKLDDKLLKPKIFIEMPSSQLTVFKDERDNRGDRDDQKDSEYSEEDPQKM